MDENDEKMEDVIKTLIAAFKKHFSELQSQISQGIGGRLECTANDLDTVRQCIEEVKRT